MFDRFKNIVDTDRTGYKAIQADAELVEALDEVSADHEAITVTAYEDNGGIEAIDDFLDAIHSVKKESPKLTGTFKNVSPGHSFEARYAADDTDQRIVSLQYVPGSKEGMFKRQLKQFYPNSDFSTEPATFIDVDEGQYVSGAELGLRRYAFYPIKNIDLEGFRTDPTGSIITEMVGAQEDSEGDADIAVQIMFKPAVNDWYATGSTDYLGVQPEFDKQDENINTSSPPGVSILAENLTDARDREIDKPGDKVLTAIPGVSKDTVEIGADSLDKKIAKMLREQRGNKGWELLLRVFAVSDSEEIAKERTAAVAGQFRNFYEDKAEQTFIPQPFSESAIRDDLVEAAARQFRETGWVKSQREVAGLVNIPKEEFINTTEMRWSQTETSKGIPPGTPRFDFDERGAANANKAKKQVAMQSITNKDTPYWFGWGAREGTEAGVFPDVFNTHAFVGGATGKGKTTFLENFWRQVMMRGHGGMFYDPKGMDTENILALTPEHRKDDIVFVQVGGDRDHQVGFNFLEVPTDADPNTQIFQEAVESIKDDILALLKEAGGEDQDSWGPRMEQISTNMTRGMARAGYNCTLLDMYLALLDEQGRMDYSSMLAEDRLDWISQYAHRELVDMSQSDIRPVLGRLKDLFVAFVLFLRD